jgi:hypothetical protein
MAYPFSFNQSIQEFSIMKIICTLAVLMLALLWSACSSPTDVPANRREDQQKDTATVQRQDSLMLSPLALDYGQMKISATSLQTVMLYNAAAYDTVVITSIVWGNGQNGFSVTSPELPLVLLPGEEGQITVRFTATRPGIFSDTLCINGVTSHCIAVRAEALSSCPKDVQFPGIAVGSSIDTTITLINMGSQSATIASITIQGADAPDFAINSLLPLPVEIQAGASYTLSVRFNPTGRRLSHAIVGFEGMEEHGAGVLQSICLWGQGL